jgi:hypothetical protein
VKKRIDFVKINFHLNEILNDIGCNLNWIEFKFLNSIQFNSTIGLKFHSIKIQLKRNKMQIGEECIENLLVNMVLKQKII